MDNNIFDIYYDDYDKWYDKHPFVFESELIALQKVIPKQGIGLEIGVGTGRFAEKLNINYGIDPSFNMLKLAKNRGINCIKGIGEKLPFKDNCFDFILVNTTLSFVNNINEVFDEIKRVLKPNKILVCGIIDRESFLGETYLENKTSKFYKDCNFLSTIELIDLLKIYNFIVLEIYQTLFKLPHLIKAIEPIKFSFGDGGFVVLKGINLK